MHGRVKAMELWRRHELAVPVDLKRLAEELGLQVTTFPFRGRINEMIVGGVVGVRPGLSRPWFRWYIAYAIGHHMLHVGTSFYLESGVLAVGQSCQGRATGRGVRRMAAERTRRCAVDGNRAGGAAEKVPADA